MRSLVPVRTPSFRRYLPDAPAVCACARRAPWLGSRSDRPRRKRLVDDQTRVIARAPRSCGPEGSTTNLDAQVARLAITVCPSAVTSRRRARCPLSVSRLPASREPRCEWCECRARSAVDACASGAGGGKNRPVRDADFARSRNCRDEFPPTLSRRRCTGAGTARAALASAALGSFAATPTDDEQTTKPLRDGRTRAHRQGPRSC